ncbi:hypothetical protein GUJ93_ZPchr0013g34223 [Zizania palustris]|nr:hypothetical protein GUJ93_ZPchr0013g34223 [Zizania palustris]
MMRNRSLTREEVDAFWRRQQRKTTSEDGGSTTTTTTTTTTIHSPLASPRAAGDVSPLASPGRAQQEETRPHPLRRQERMSMSSSMPSSPLARSAMTRADPYEAYCGVQQRVIPDHSPADMSSGCWWTRSSWAFLNDTPSPEEQKFGRRQTYACVQFHVARIVTGNA